MTRSQALIAVAAAVAVAAVVVVVGLHSGSDGDAGAASTAATVVPSTGALPSGHPSIVASEETSTPAAEPTQDVGKLEQETSQDPGDVQALLDLGNAYFMRQQLRQAERTFTRVLGLEPDNAAAQVGLALVWHAQGDSKRAEHALDAVIEAHPDNQDAHYTLAIVYFSTGRVSEAKKEWQTAASIDPSTTTGKRSQSFVKLLEDQETSSPAAN